MPNSFETEIERLFRQVTFKRLRQEKRMQHSFPESPWGHQPLKTSINRQSLRTKLRLFYDTEPNEKRAWEKLKREIRALE